MYIESTNIKLPLVLKIAAGYLVLVGVSGFLFQFFDFGPHYTEYAQKSMAFRIGSQSREFTLNALFLLSGIGILLRKLWARKLAFILIPISTFYTASSVAWGMMHSKPTLGASVVSFVIVAVWNAIWFWLIFRQSTKNALSTTTASEHQLSNIEQGQRVYEIAQASKWLRLGTLLVDTACLFVLQVLLLAIISSAFSINADGIKSILGGPIIIIIFVLLDIAFYLLFEGIWRRTPGKYLLGTIVVNEVGRKASFRQIVERTFCRFIPFDWISFMNLDHRGWHDSISKTYVVLVRKFFVLEDNHKAELLGSIPSAVNTP